jgi:hypothetical protein
VVHPPYRPGRGRGRPRHEIEAERGDACDPAVAPPLLPPLTPIERRAFDYTA